MKRYVDFASDGWADRTDSRMQATRWTACVDGMGTRPPDAGVIDDYPEEVLRALVEEGWTRGVQTDETGDAYRLAVREAVLETLKDDADFLAAEEHTLVERMLIDDGSVPLETVAEMEAAYTLRMRLWCDLGMLDGEPTARLDAQLMRLLPELLMRKEHHEHRERLFVFDGMMHGILYIVGYLDDRMPRRKFIEEVLRTEPSPWAERIARNYLEASFDMHPQAGGSCLVHEALADPADAIAQVQAPELPEVTPGQLAASMNGLLPEEQMPDEALQRAIVGALRPEYEPYEAASDLRFLAKQNVPMGTLEEIMASMLVVMPTEHMHGALRDLRHHTPRWYLPDRPSAQTPRRVH